MNNFNIKSMLEITKKEFNDADVTIIPSDSEDGQSIRLSWKTEDSKKYNTKRYQPVIISLHEDFCTSEFFQNTIEIMTVKYSGFLQNKRSELEKRTKEKSSKIHSSNYWVFPQKC